MNTYGKIKKYKRGKKISKIKIFKNVSKAVKPRRERKKKCYQYKNLYEDNTLLCSVRFDAMN